jgi:hypothetical protein
VPQLFSRYEIGKFIFSDFLWHPDLIGFQKKSQKMMKGGEAFVYPKKSDNCFLTKEILK